MAVVADKRVPEVEVTSDASGSWGCGAHWGSQWLQVPWNDQSKQMSIAAKELVVIIIAVAVWGRQWQGKCVLRRSDNMAVSLINAWTAKEHTLMHMLRCPCFFEARYEIQLIAVHIKGTLNVLADDLSHDRLSLFLNKVPHAAASPSPVPPPLLDLIMYLQPDWTSESWIRLFASIVKTALYPQPKRHTRLVLLNLWIFVICMELLNQSLYHSLYYATSQPTWHNRACQYRPSTWLECTTYRL